MSTTTRWQRVQGSRGNAFAVESGPPRLTPEDEALLDRLADAVVRRHMETPALLFLETTRPVSYLASQWLHFLEPFATQVLNRQQYGRLACLLERRGTPEELMRRIEQRLPAQGRAPAAKVVRDGDER